MIYILPYENSDYALIWKNTVRENPCSGIFYAVFRSSDLVKIIYVTVKLCLLYLWPTSYSGSLCWQTTRWRIFEFLQAIYMKFIVLANSYCKGNSKVIVYHWQNMKLNNFLREWTTCCLSLTDVKIWKSMGSSPNFVSNIKEI